MFQYNCTTLYVKETFIFKKNKNKLLIKLAFLEVNIKQNYCQK
jgi:hypothetical protein